MNHHLEKRFHDMEKIEFVAKAKFVKKIINLTK